MLNCMATYRSSGQKAGAVTLLEHIENMKSTITSIAKFAAVAPSIKLPTAGMTALETCGSALKEAMEGDRPYRVNSGNISLRRS